MDKEENRVVDADALEASGVTVHVTHVRTVEDVAPTLARLAAALGIPAPRRSRAPRSSATVRRRPPTPRRPGSRSGGGPG